MNKAMLINLLAEKGLTQATLAEKTGLSRTAVNNMLNHGARPRLDTLGKLARVLGVKPSELLQD